MAGLPTEPLGLTAGLPGRLETFGRRRDGVGDPRRAELARLKVRQHPGKTFIGRIARGFDFLGYQFTPSGLGIARPTGKRFVGRARRFYEQGADWLRIDEYVRRWWKWVRAGIDSMIAENAWNSVVELSGAGRIPNRPIKRPEHFFQARLKTENQV